MKKIILTHLALVISLFAIAQSTPTLSITGEAKLTVKPEKVVISYTISATKNNYSDVLGKMNDGINSLTQSLIRIGFNKEEIKTSNFNIRKTRTYNQGEPKGEAFIASQSLEIQFEHSTNRLLEVLNRTASGEAAPSISISFRLSKKQEKIVKEKLMKMAVKDAKSKAEILATTAGYKLGGVKEINYGNATLRPQVNSSARMPGIMSVADSGISNFEAKDLSLSDRVSIVFELIK